jgi:hypothetical protein
VISYSEQSVFTVKELALFHRASNLVATIPNSFKPEIRCHELARAVGDLLKLPHCDGTYGRNAKVGVEHTWLVLSPWARETRILDVYSVGSLPIVQLVHTNCFLPKRYHAGVERTDIRSDVVAELKKAMRPAGFSMSKSCPV